MRIGSEWRISITAWKILVEEVSNTKLFSKEEAECEEIFKNEYRRSDDGKFEVALPFREDSRVLGDFKASAFR